MLGGAQLDWRRKRDWFAIAQSPRLWRWWRSWPTIFQSILKTCTVVGVYRDFPSPPVIGAYRGNLERFSRPHCIVKNRFSIFGVYRENIFHRSLPWGRREWKLSGGHRSISTRQFFPQKVISADWSRPVAGNNVQNYLRIWPRTRTQSLSPGS